MGELGNSSNKEASLDAQGQGMSGQKDHFTVTTVRKAPLSLSPQRQVRFQNKGWSGYLLVAVCCLLLSCFLCSCMNMPGCRVLWSQTQHHESLTVFGQLFT